ncbi:phosphoprotein [Ninorex virus]|nr:phosphoprotein [Ninorex virus]
MISIQTDTIKVRYTPETEPNQKMSSNELPKEVQRGLAAAEYFIAHPKVHHPTYGRSAISKPGTQDRVKAWEDFRAINDNSGAEQQRGDDSGDDIIEGGDESSNGPVPVHSSQERSRYIKEAKLEEADRDLFPDALDSDIQEYDSRGQSSNGESSPEVVRSKSNQLQGDGTGKRNDAPDTSELSILRQGSLPEDGASQKSKPEPKSVMDPKAAPFSPPTYVPTKQDSPERSDTAVHQHDGSVRPKNTSQQGNTNKTKKKNKNKPERKLQALAQTSAGSTSGLMTAEAEKDWVKRGTEGKSPSIGMEGKSSSESGATHSAPQPPQQPADSHVDVDGVSPGAMILGVHPSPIVLSQGSGPYLENRSHSNETDETNVYDPAYIDPMQSIYEGIDAILRNQTYIIQKLEQNDSLYEEIEKIKDGITKLAGRIECLDRTVGKQGLSISEMESMLSDMKVMIPGKPGKNNGNKIQVNPTLTPIIGRPDQHVEETIDIDFDDLDGVSATIKEELILPDIDEDTTHASKFVIRDDSATRMTLESWITVRINNPEVSLGLKEYLANARSKDDLELVYDAITEAIDNGL